MDACRGFRIIGVLALVCGVALASSDAAWAGSKSKSKPKSKRASHSGELSIRVTRNMLSGVSHVYEVNCPKGSGPEDFCELRRFSSAGEQDRFARLSRADAQSVAMRLGARFPASRSRTPNSKPKTRQLKPMLSWNVAVPSSGRALRGQVDHGELRGGDPDRKKIAAAIGLLEANLKASQTEY